MLDFKKWNGNERFLRVHVKISLANPFDVEFSLFYIVHCMRDKELKVESKVDQRS